MGHVDEGATQCRNFLIVLVVEVECFLPSEERAPMTDSVTCWSLERNSLIF